MVYGISTLVGKLMPKPIYKYSHIEYIYYELGYQVLPLQVRVD